MPTDDVREGLCGCGACEWHKFTTPDWYFDADGSLLKLGAGSSCPICHYRLDPDGFARRMLGATVEELRERISTLQARAANADNEATEEEAVGGLCEGELADLRSIAAENYNRADELERLLREEAEDANC